MVKKYNLEFKTLLPVFHAILWSLESRLQTSFLSCFFGFPPVSEGYLLKDITKPNSPWNKTQLQLINIYIQKTNMPINRG
jgi:hypothetical protein